MKTEKYQINEPCVVDVLVKDKYASISWSLENGTDEIKVDLDKEDVGTLQFEFGDTSQIGYGGTDNWGKDLLPIYVNYEKNSQEGDSVYVNNIIIQEYAGDGNWCKCERLKNGAVMYTALSENPFNEPRVAYFKHKTTDEVLADGFYKGRRALKEWYVTVIQKENPNIIGYGGTDNWGKDVYPIHLGYEKNSQEGDSVFVENITIQEYAGDDNWCKCERLKNGAVMYTALSENPNEEPRIAYFKHQTTDEILSGGYYKGQKALSEWYVTVIQDGNPSIQEDIIESENPDVIEDNSYTFDNWIDMFNEVLTSNNKRSISKSSNIYRYLNTMFDSAIDELKNNTHNLFNDDIFNEIYQYRGNNDKFEKSGMSKNIIGSWILAMCLSEIMPTSGTLTNMQTEFFKLAYNKCGGRNVSLYDNYTLKSDPTVLRYIAGAVYSIMRGEYSFEYIDSLRTEIGSMYISASDWSGLQYSSSDAKSIRYLGYLVNSDLIIPSAPGPYTNDSNPNGRPKPWNEGQNKNQFYFGDFANDWYNGNYKVDVELDKYVTENYNMGSETYNTSKGWETYDKEKKLLMLHAATMPFATDHYFYGSKRVKFDGVKYVESDKFWRYFFSETSEAPTPTNNIFDIIGPFAKFEKKMFTSGYGITNNMKFFQNVMDMADNSRFPTYHTEYGRRRPLGGETPGTCRGGEINGHPLNGILAGTIGCLFADNEAGYIKRRDCDDFPHDGPRTYPSGHAAMTWTVAMMLGQMDPENIGEYMKEAYKIGIGRTLARFHWNSDTMYGRLFATFIMPIMNAMQGLQSTYQSTKNSLFNGNIGEIGKDIDINLTIVNKSDKDVTLNGTLKFVLANPDINGTYYGWQGLYNRTDYITFNSSKITIKSGSSKEFKNIHCSGMSGRNLVSASTLSQITYQTNVLLYDENGESGIINPENLSSEIYFKNGGNYTLVIPGNSLPNGASEGMNTDPSTDHEATVNETVTIVNNSGKTITFKGVITFVMYGYHPTEKRNYYYRPKGYCSGNDFTLKNGESKTYKVEFKGNALYNGYPLANQTQRSKYKSNAAYYNDQGEGYTCESLLKNYTHFIPDSNYTIVIPKNTAEWTNANTESQTP